MILPFHHNAFVAWAFGVRTAAANWFPWFDSNLLLFLRHTKIVQNKHNNSTQGIGLWVRYRLRIANRTTPRKLASLHFPLEVLVLIVPGPLCYLRCLLVYEILEFACISQISADRVVYSTILAYACACISQCFGLAFCRRFSLVAKVVTRPAWLAFRVGWNEGRTRMKISLSCSLRRKRLPRNSKFRPVLDRGCSALSHCRRWCAVQFYSTVQQYSIRAQMLVPPWDQIFHWKKARTSVKGLSWEFGHVNSTVDFEDETDCLRSGSK